MRLGEGGFGHVTASVPGKAIKHTEIFEGSNLSGNFFEAVFAATSMARPVSVSNVVGFTRLDTCTKDQFHIEMERGTGTLSDYVPSRSWRQRNSDIDEIIRDLSTALHQLHCVGIVHGDLKPGNIIVTERLSAGPWVRLIDFGSARFWNRPVAPSTGRREVACTYEFCAPEAMRTGRDPTPAWDAYALGATIYYYLMRRYLWSADRKATATDADRSAALDALHMATDGITQMSQAAPGMSEQVFRIMKGLLHPDPTQRTTVASLACPATIQIPPIILDGPPIAETNRVHSLQVIDRLYNMCKDGDLEAVFAPAVNVAMRFAGATGWPVQEASLRACLEIVVAVNNPDHVMEGPLLQRSVLLSVMKALDFRMYTDTCDWLLLSVHGHPSIHMPLLCNVLKLCDGRTQDAVALYRQHSDHMVIE